MPMTIRWQLLFTVATTMAIAGCGSGSAAEGTAVLDGRTFVTMGDEQEQDLPLVAGTRVRLTFRNGEVAAEAGCNHLAGSVAADGDRLVVSEVGGTAMGCSPGLADQDTRVARFLQGRPRWALNGDSLLLSTDTARLRLTDVRSAEPDRPLTGVRWALDTLMENGTAGSVPAGAQAYLVIDAGRVTGSTGCTGFEGPASIAAGSVTFPGLSTRKIHCSKTLEGWDSGVLALLRGRLSVHTTGNRLTLTAADGRGMQFAALPR
ncbi:META domain-containing protein [Couchioplanes caeruleus]|uniref:META domain-containing protein n=1 Tax=Couchioplanes caeruleus TaxID=56438 RepID=UPI0020C13EBB|nr:META domain-containing protein [Couchioplanes caeruleus]UQU63441.1 META domain-containing protein [Couchioplanes caeruleus]